MHLLKGIYRLRNMAYQVKHLKFWSKESVKNSGTHMQLRTLKLFHPTQRRAVHHLNDSENIPSSLTKIIQPWHRNSSRTRSTGPYAIYSIQNHNTLIHYNTITLPQMAFNIVSKLKKNKSVFVTLKRHLDTFLHNVLSQLCYNTLNKISLLQ